MPYGNGWNDIGESRNKVPPSQKILCVDANSTLSGSEVDLSYFVKNQ